MAQSEAKQDKVAREKAEAQAEEPAEVVSPEKGGATEAQVKRAAGSLPVYDEEERIRETNKLKGHSIPPGEEGELVPDTPSGYAVKKVGNLDGEDVDHSKPGATEAARRHGEEYQYHKALLRWGPGPQPPEYD